MESESKKTRDIILDATNVLLARKGYKKMKVEDIALEAGIGKGSVYLHFESKEDIALAHLDRMVAGIREHLKQICESADTASTRLEKVLVDRIMIRFDNVQHYSQSINELMEIIRPSLANRRVNLVNVEAEMIASLISDGQNSGEFAPGSAKTLGKTLVDATDSLLPYSLSAFETKDRREVKRRAVALTNLLINGLRYRRQ